MFSLVYERIDISIAEGGFCCWSMESTQIDQLIISPLSDQYLCRLLFGPHKKFECSIYYVKPCTRMLNVSKLCWYLISLFRKKQNTFKTSAISRIWEVFIVPHRFLPDSGGIKFGRGPSQIAIPVAIYSSGIEPFQN